MNFRDAVEYLTEGKADDIEMILRRAGVDRAEAGELAKEIEAVGPGVGHMPRPHEKTAEGGHRIPSAERNRVFRKLVTLLKAEKGMAVWLEIQREVFGRSSAKGAIDAPEFGHDDLGRDEDDPADWWKKQ